MAAPVSRNRIAFCITDLDPGGAERALVQLVTRLDRQRFEPHVICLSRPGMLLATLEANKISATCLNASGRWQIGVIGKLSRELRRWRPALLQTFLFHANLAGRLAAWRAGIPHVVSGIRVAERRRNGYLTLDRWTESLVEKHVCVSQAVLDFSINRGGLDPQKLCVIPNGVDYQRFAAAPPLALTPWNIAPDDEVWVTVGRLDRQKGPWDLLRAVSQLLGSHPKLKLLWAGAGPLRNELQAWIDLHQLQDCIKLIGWLDDVPGLLRAARGFVLCSHWEGMPNVILEAMASGIPVVSTPSEGVREIITHGQTGWIAAAAEEFATCWNEVLKNPTAAAQAALAGQQRVREQFTWEAMAARYMDLYEAMLSGKPLEKPD